MPHTRPPDPMASFTTWFQAITSGLSPSQGWYAVFLRRDPQGMRASLSGAGVPPWDIVASLLQDMNPTGDPGPGAQEDALRLHRAALREHTLRSGRPALVNRLENALLERHKAERNLAALASRNTEQRDPQQVPWAQDVHRRAVQRCTELHRCLADLDDAASVLEEAPPEASVAPSVPNDSAPAVHGTRSRAGRIGASLTSLGLGLLQGPSVQSGFMLDSEPDQQEETEEDPALAASDWRWGRRVAWQLGLLRANGSGGQAHMLLCETVTGAARRLPLLAQALEETGQPAEVSVLVWEIGSLPPGLLAEAMVAFVDHGRNGDVALLLRQSSARQPADLADLVASLVAAGRAAEATLVLQYVVRSRPREFAVDLARIDATVVPLLLKAAGKVSEPHQLQVHYALRLAGF